MSERPLMLLDPHFRRVDELFRPAAFERLASMCDIVGAGDAPMAPAQIDALIDRAAFYVAAFPRLNAQQIARARQLRAVIEVAGAFNDGLDFAACARAGVEVLSCSPGFRQSVAEMTLAMVLAGGRGLIDEHEAFRTGTERWLDDCPERDFSLYGQTVGFVGMGQIARETCRLMAPFAPHILAHDPWLEQAPEGVRLCALGELVERARVVVIAAVPSEETREMLDAGLIARLQPGALVVLVSRAWCVDFTALVEAAREGRIRLATDVYPEEPLSADDPLRQLGNTLLSPHRAAAVAGGRQLIGDMLVDDVAAILADRPQRSFKPMDPAQLEGLLLAQRGIQGK